jgi:hypothetical protein
VQADPPRPGRRSRRRSEAAGALGALARRADEARRSLPPDGAGADVLESGRRRLIAWLAQDLHARLDALRASLDTLGDPVTGGVAAVQAWEGWHRDLEGLAALVDDVAALAAAATADERSWSDPSGGDRVFDLAYEGGP